MQNATYSKDDISAKAHIGKTLGALARSIDAKTIVETGTFRGLTTIELARQNPQATIYSFEFNPKIIKQARFIIALTGQSNIRIIEGDVLKELPKKARKISPIDFVFLDDAKKNYRKNFEAVLPYLSPHAIVCAHDTNFEPANITAAKEFGKYLNGQTNFSCLNVDWNDRGLTIAQKKGMDVNPPSLKRQASR